MKKTLLLRLAVLILIQWPLAVHAIPFDNLYVFGDSLSDVGNDSMLTGGLIPPPEYTDGTTSGRFTNGRNYIDYLSQSLGLTVTPSLAGGTDYAYGGARTNSANLPGALSLLQQSSSYLSSLRGGSADPNALYIVWAGANNLSDILTQMLTNPLYNPTPDLTTAVNNLGFVVSSLAQAGARDILVPNIPDLGIIPAVTGGGPRNPLVSWLVAGFNADLGSTLNGFDQTYPGLHLMRLDTFSLVDKIYNNPAAYNLTNVTDPCYSKFVQSGGTTCSNPNQYLFWDAEHPTTAVHQILARDVLRTVPEPSTVALFAVGLVALATVRKRRGGLNNWRF